MRLLYACCLVGALTIIIHSSSHADELIDATDPQKLLDIARGWGSASLTKDDSGDPFIRGRMEGNKYAILFYGCHSGADCDSVGFVTSWSKKGIPLSKVNAWNERKRFGRAYLDKDNDIAMDMHVNLDRGVSVKNLETTFEWWSVIIKEFEEEFIRD